METPREPRRPTDAQVAVSVDAGPSEATAVLVWHGMGQQVPFQTIGRVARSLAAHEHFRSELEPLTTVRLVKLGDLKISRAELELCGADKRRHAVHIYEAHWAPLTQGKITVAETVQFLFNAAYQAIRHSLAAPQFQRFLFNRWVTFDLKRPLTAVYVVLLLALVSLIGINAAITVTLLVKPFAGLTNPDSWPTFALLQDLTVDFGLLALTAFVAGAAFFLAFWRERPCRQAGLPSTPHRGWQWLLWTLAVASLLMVFAVGGLIAWHLVSHLFSDERWWNWPRAWAPIHLPAAALAWLSVLAASAGVRWFLLEFVGDSAIYVWSHVLNKFFETRQAIKQQSLETAAAIYRFGGYRQHILIGHSLGAVIAYDTLNQLLNDDVLEGGALKVRQRTRLLLTFGAILDKTAFLFRAQTGQNDVREALASAEQPLISDPGARPRWVNLFSPHDVFGGRIDYYDPANGTSGPAASGGQLQAATGIINKPDPSAWIPLLAHDQYWTSPVLVQELVAAIVSPATDDARPAVR